MDRQVKRKLLTPARIVLLVVLIAALIGAAYLYPSFDRWRSADRSVSMQRLRFGTAVRGDLLRDVSAQGKIIAADRPTLVSPAQGIVSILVKAGDMVRRGDTLARIDSPALRNQKEQEESVLLSLRSELERQRIANRQTQLQDQQQVSLLEVRQEAGERALERTRTLLEEGLGNSIDYEKARDDLRIVRLELEHARQKLELDRETLEFELRSKELEVQRQVLIVENLNRQVNELSVISPVNGLVANVEVQDKDTVQPNQKLFSVVDLSEFEVEISIPENYAAEVVTGTQVKIRYEGEEYTGEVKSLSPEVAQSQVRGVVIFTDDPPEGLKQNQRVDVRLILDSRPDVIKVPRGPFLESMGGRQAYVVENGIAVLRPIRVGSISVTEIEVTSGIEEGETVVLSDLARFEGAKMILLRQ